MVVKPEHEPDIKKIFGKWDLHAVTIGKVIDQDRVQIYHHGELKADVPAETLVLGGGAPVYVRESREPEYLDKLHSFDPTTLPVPDDFNQIFLNLLGSPTIACKRWVYNQYDSMVRTNTVPASYDSSIVRIKGTRKGIALKTDGNARYVYLNPRRGGQIAVAEAARNVACSGATPVAITNCLNFGNPYDPEIYWQFTEAVAGIGDACRALDTPVTGGNVSFYNESPAGAVLPTPVIGMLGVIDDADKAVSSTFQHEGDMIMVLGRDLGEIGGSEYLFQQTGQLLCDAPSMDLAAEANLQALCRELSAESLIASAHDCAEGGLAVALAESLMESDPALGVQMSKFPSSEIRPDFALFGETQSRVIISVNPDNINEVRTAATFRGVPATVIGEVTGDATIRLSNKINVSAETARNTYRTAISKAVEG
jgi:phosphoribosylformylglycinamidine synthase subunit PurL